MTNVVLDTRCLLMSLSSKGRYFSVWKNLLAGKYVLCLTNDILTEYEEILTQKIGKAVAGNIISVLMNLPNLKKVDVYYHFLLIKSDPDDDKFVDCAIKANFQANFGTFREKDFYYFSFINPNQDSPVHMFLGRKRGMWARRMQAVD